MYYLNMYPNYITNNCAGAGAALLIIHPKQIGKKWLPLNIYFVSAKYHCTRNCHIHAKHSAIKSVFNVAQWTCNIYATVIPDNFYV